MDDLKLRELTDAEKEEIKRLAPCYDRVIYWSEEDRCYIGSLPDLCGECCHGATRDSVETQLITCAEMNLELNARMGEPFPKPCTPNPATVSA